jgi:hypothetical protein
MLPEELKSVLKKRKKNVFIYDWEFFTRRIHDELVFSVIEGYQFLYVEITFATVEKELRRKNERLKFWHAFFDQLDKKRFSDLCGFLDNGSGIAVIFTHTSASSNSIAWVRFCENVLSKSGFNMQKWLGINHAEYPPKEFIAPT